MAIATLVGKVCTPIFKRILRGSLAASLTAVRGLTIRSNENGHQMRRRHRGQYNR